MNTYKNYFFFFVLALGLSFSGCVDNEFDKPENTLRISDDQVISIADVLDLLGDDPVLLDESNIGDKVKYIKATVNADDASGNFYKVVSFQDATGGLSIVPDRNELNAEFPIGNTVYVKLQGLTLGYDEGLPRLGYGAAGTQLQRIPDILINDFLIPGGKGEELVPEVTTITNFLINSNQFYNRLIKLEDVEFTDEFVGQTFADPDHPDGPRGLNTFITDCDDNEIILRNSGFADFASNIIPFQNGDLIAIASTYDGDFQLFIRNTDDIKFANDRCDGSGGNQDVEEITIQSIQDRFYELGADKAEKGFITGTVISDKNTGQVNGQNVFLQNGEDGVLVRFSGEHNFDLGTQLKVIVTGQEVSEFRNLLQINNVPLFNVEEMGIVELPTPTELTVETLLQNNNAYESTRVLIKGATLSGSSTFDGEVFVNDGTDEVVIFTFNTTSYANEPVPSGVVDVIGIVSQYDDVVQLVINGPDDISQGTVDPGGEDRIRVEDVQDRFYNLGADKTEEGYIEGVVISDKNTGQVNGQNVFFQDGEYGILVRFTEEHDFNVGAKLRITVSGSEVSEFRGLLQINNVPLQNATQIATSEFAAKEITVGELLSNNNRYESTKVLIKNATLSGSATFNGNVTVDDGTGQINIFTFSTTSYADEPVPTGIVNVEAIVSQYDEQVQLVINGADKITGGTVDPGGDDNVATGFENYSDGDPINKDGWMTVATKGTRTWFSTSYQGERFAECEAYEDSNPETEAWLITPTIDTDSKSIFSFQTAQAFWEHQGLTVWISQDFTDLDNANWVALDQARLANNSDDFFLLVDSGDIDLKDYFGGKVRVGFKYEGTASSNTTKIRLDNVELK